MRSTNFRLALSRRLLAIMRTLGCDSHRQANASPHSLSCGSHYTIMQHFGVIPAGTIVESGATVAGLSAT